MRDFLFRFLVVWLFLYWQGLCAVLLPFIGGALFRKRFEPLWNGPTDWFASHLLGIAHPVGNHPTLGSDTQFYWTRDLLFIVLALLVALIWTALRRNHTPTARGWGWLWIALRFVLAGQMAGYGAVKVFPVQMLEPTPNELLTQFGGYTPMHLLWAWMGAAPCYEVATGVVELSSAVLLALPRVWTIGAALAVIALGQVTLLDLFYDVPVKLHCTHLLAMAVILLVPHIGRLWDVLVANRRVDPLPAVSPTGKRSGDRTVAVVMAVSVMLLVATELAQDHSTYRLFGPGKPTPPLYGAWRAQEHGSVQYFVVNGYDITEVIEQGGAQHAKADIVLRPSEGGAQNLVGDIDQHGHRITLAERGKPTPPTVLRYEELGPDRIKLSGERLGPPFELVFERVRLDQLPLNKDRGVRWVDEAPTG